MTANMDSPSSSTMFEVHVAKDTFKFNAAHFVAYPGFRERLHGHNYQVSVRLLGGKTIGPDGYVIDFGNIKSVTKQVCKELNEHFLCPTLSNVLEITTSTSTEACSSSSSATANPESVTLKCQDGSVFVFPKSDCAMLPIVHATAEELAIYLWSRILVGLDANYLLQRGIHTMEVTCAEAVGQDATFRMQIPSNGLDGREFDVAQYIMSGNVVPKPCPAADGSGGIVQTKEKKCRGEKCSCLPFDFSSKLQELAEMINDEKLKEHSEPVTVKDLESVLIGK